jgi:hypothetical protein
MEVQIDRAEILRRCEEFFSLYDIMGGRTYDMCEAKIEHSRIVATNCDDIARNLGFDRYDTDIAWIIGELHDFGRFGQIVVYETFRDSEQWNHAHLGAGLLFDHGLINDIIPNWDEIADEDRLVMKKAIYHHSDFKLPEGLTEREETYCRLIREADQIDIFRTIVQSGWKTIYGHTKEEISDSDFSDEIVAAIFRHELADYSKRVTYADYHLAHIALCFGLTSPAAHHRVLEQGYLEQMMDIEFTHPEVQQRFSEIRAEVHGYLTA